MSSPNIEVVERAFEIFNRLGAALDDSEVLRTASDEFAAIATEDFEYREDPEWPGAQVQRGLESYRKVMASYADSLDQMTAEIEQTFERGDRVVVFVRWLARGKSSGAEAEMRPGQVFTLDQGRIAKQEVYLDRDEALAAAGISD